MSKNTSNKFLKNFSKIVVGTSIAASVGVGAFYIFKAVHSDEYKSAYQPKIFEGFDNIDLKVTESYETTPYLGQEGLKKLKDRINNDLGYGPEVQGLKNINIVDSHYIGSANNGVFFDATKQIFVNANNMRKLIPDSGDLDDKVEVVFQIVFHEYGHFIASSYLKNNNPGSTVGSTPIADIYYNNDPKHKMTWSKYFTDKFKKLLRYDVDDSKYPYTNEVWWTIENGKKIKHVGSHKLLAHEYNAKELFDLANGNKKPSYIPNIEDYVFGGRVNPTILFKNKKNILPYLYNLDELYTRKYQLTNMVLTQNSKFKNGWIVDSKNKIINYTPFIRDVLHYQPNTHFQESGVPEYDAKWRFFNDSPYGLQNNPTTKPDGTIKNSWTSTAGVSKEMNDLMLEEFGQSNGSDISYITSRNTSEVLNDSKYLPSGNGKQIKLGGYLNTNESYNFIGTMEPQKNGTSKFVGYPISTNTFKYGYKTSGLLGTNKTQATGENKFYTTNKWIDVDKIKNKNLVFSNDADGTITKELVSVRDKKVGKTSNYFQNSPSVIRNYYEAYVTSSGKVRIKGGIWN